MGSRVTVYPKAGHVSRGSQMCQVNAVPPGVRKRLVTVASSIPAMLTSGGIRKSRMPGNLRCPPGPRHAYAQCPHKARSAHYVQLPRKARCNRSAHYAHDPKAVPAYGRVPLTTARWTCLPAHAGFCDLVGGGGGGDRGGPGPELHRFGVGARTAGGLEAADQRVVADDRDRKS